MAITPMRKGTWTPFQTEVTIGHESISDIESLPHLEREHSQGRKGLFCSPVSWTFE